MKDEVYINEANPQLKWSIKRAINLNLSRPQNKTNVKNGKWRVAWSGWGVIRVLQNGIFRPESNDSAIPNPKLIGPDESVLLILRTYKSSQLHLRRWSTVYMGRLTSCYRHFTQLPSNRLKSWSRLLAKVFKFNLTHHFKPLLGFHLVQSLKERHKLDSRCLRPKSISI